MGNLGGSSTAEIDAPIDEVWAIVEDVTSAPDLQGGLIAVTALEKDDEGRATLVESKSDIKVRHVTTKVRFSYAGPEELSWKQEKGDLKSRRRLVEARGPRRRAHACDLLARRLPRPHDRDARPRTRRGRDPRHARGRPRRRAQGTRRGRLSPRRCRPAPRRERSPSARRPPGAAPRSRRPATSTCSAAPIRIREITPASS